MATSVYILASSLAASIVLARHQFTTSFLLPFLLLTIVQYAGLFLYRAILYPFFLSPIRDIPGPEGGNIILGQFPKISEAPSGEPQIEWIRTIPNDGLIRYLGMWNRERIMVTNVKMLQEVLHAKSYTFGKPSILKHSPIAQVLGPQGILFAEGDIHRHQRKSLLAAFHYSHIKNLIPIFWEKSVYLTDRIASKIETGETKDPEKGTLIDMSTWASLSTLDIIGEAGFGTDFKAMETEGQGSDLAVAYSTIFSQPSGRGATILRFLSVTLPPWVMQRLPIKRRTEFNNSVQTLKRVSLDLVTRRRRELDLEDEARKRTGKSTGDDLNILTAVLRSGEYEGPEAQEVIRDQLLTFLAAGHETTASSLVWALYLLTQHPEHQTRVRDEVRAAFPSGPPKHMTSDQLDSLKYVRNVTEETTRVFPAVPLTMREAYSDTTLGDHFVPKGTTIIIPVWAVNMDSAYWQDADEFRPDRWNQSGGGAESNYNLSTFLHGPRSCLGKDFSKNEFKALLAALVGRFEFTSDGGELKIASGLTSRPKGGLKVWVKEVPGWGQ